MLVVKKGTEDERIASVADTTSRACWAKAAFLLERLEIYLRNGRSRQHLFRVSTARWGCDIASHPWVREADILHLHWINQGFLSLTTLKKFAALRKPSSLPCTTCGLPRVSVTSLWSWDVRALGMSTLPSGLWLLPPPGE